MKRRDVLRSVATLTGGLLALPSWANGWNGDTVRPKSPQAYPLNSNLLAEVVETIIPATDTPGAKALDIHSFIGKMLADCYEKEVQDNFVKGLDAVEKGALQNFGKPFDHCETLERTALLQKMEVGNDLSQREFYALLKKLTILGYTTSEYYLTTHANYQMIPGHYYGCVPVNPN